MMLIFNIDMGWYIFFYIIKIKTYYRKFNLFNLFYFILFYFYYGFNFYSLFYEKYLYFNEKKKKKKKKKDLNFFFIGYALLSWFYQREYSKSTWNITNNIYYENKNKTKTGN